MALEVYESKQGERNLLEAGELIPAKVYLSTRNTGFKYFVVKGWSYGRPVIGYADEHGRIGHVDQRETTREFYEAPKGTYITIKN